MVYVVWGVAMYYRSYWAQLAGHRVMLDLRTDLFQHIQRLSHSFFLSRQSGGIVSRLTADIALAQNFVGAAMTNIWMDVVACLFYLALLLAMNVQLTIAALAVFPLYIACMRIYGKASKRTSKQVQEAMEEFSGDMQERIGGYTLVKSFGAEQREVRGFFARARGLHELVMDNVRITNLSSTLVQWLTEMATLALIWYGGYLIFKGQAQHRRSGRVHSPAAPALLSGQPHQRDEHRAAQLAGRDRPHLRGVRYPAGRARAARRAAAAAGCRATSASSASRSATSRVRLPCARWICTCAPVRWSRWWGRAVPARPRWCSSSRASSIPTPGASRSTATICAT